MSLFKTKEWWRTECGTEETFDGQSLLVAPLFGPEKGDIVVVGSHSGYLRIYSPASQWAEDKKSATGYKFTDLMIETKLCDCIIDLKAGKFVSGSQDLRLAVLTPIKLLVCGIALSQESSEHGDRCSINVVYEHNLDRFPASLTTGPFGGTRGRDFFCVQCLDSTLLFYEQEAHTFAQTLNNRLLPETLVYVSRNDVFVTSSSAWNLECYRYQNLAESGMKVEVARDVEGDGTRGLEPDWTYNLGEAVLGIEAVTLSSFEVGIVVLAERNLYCFRDNCTALKYSKRLEYNPVCFRAYVIEPDGKLMVLVVADTDTLLLYEGTTLKWSAQLPFTPVAIARAHFQHLEGVIVILSDEGRLEACYLGAEPSLFIAPPLHRRAGFDYKASEKELLELRKQAKHSATADKLTNSTVESELLIAINVSKDLENSATDTGEDGEGRISATCRISVDLSSYTSIHDLEINIEATSPVVVSDRFHVFPNLADRQVIRTGVFLVGNRPALSAEITVTASYETDDGNLRVLRKSANLPLRMFLRACPPENTAFFSATIKNTDKSLANFSHLFPEFMGENTQRSSALGLQHTNTGNVVTIVAGVNTNRYRIQSNDPLSMTLVLEQLVARLQSRYPGSYVATIGQNHLQLVQSQIEVHFATRQRVKRIMNEIGLLTTQLRNIERRILRGVRERNSRCLAATGLPTLLGSTYRTIFAHLEDLTGARAERERAGHDLQCALRLLLLLLRLNVNDDKYAMLESAIGFEPQLRDDVDWEEVADVALGALLRFTSRKFDNPEASSVRPTLNWNKFETARDIAKLKKRVVHAVERLNKASDIAEIESGINR